MNIKKRFFVLLLVVILAVSTNPVMAGAAAGLDNFSYTVRQGWKFVDSDVSITSSGNNWTDGYLDIAVSSGGETADQFRLLSSGPLSIAGDAVSWNNTRIGTIDPFYNGTDGRNLRINFSASLLNSGFESGFTGWSVNESFPGLPGDTPEYITQIARVQSGTVYQGSYAAELSIQGGVTTNCGTAHGPEITSSTFYAQAGDTLSLRWNALDSGDDYDVYGYLRNPSSGAEQTLFYSRGDNTNGWNTLNATIQSSVCPSGTCGMQFRFLAGTYDATCGRAVGSTLYIDGISVVTSVATDAAVDYIVEHLEYQNTSTSPNANKTYRLTMKDAASEGSATAGISVSKASTSTTITGLAPEPSVYGQNYSVSVQVAALSPSLGTPDGTVNVSDGLGNSCAIPLSGGSGSCSLPSSSAGGKTIQAAYAGTALGYNGSSTTLSHTVNKATTTTQATRSVASPVYGQPVTFTAAVDVVAPGAITPAGQVQFYMDGAPFGLPVNLSGGSAALTSTSLSAGDHTYWAEYLGNSNNFASSTAPASFHIDQNSTTTTVESSSPTSVFGQPVHLTATVDEVLPSVVTPDGQVQFYIDSAPFGDPVSLNAFGQAASEDLHTLLPGGLLPVGEYTFSAAYLGNANTLPSSTTDQVQTVNPAPTTLVVLSSENPTVYGISLEMTIDVSADAPSAAVPAGKVQLAIDGVAFGTPLTLDGSGQARRTVPYLNLWPGSHAVTALYTPDEPAQFTGANNNTLPLEQVVEKANPVFELTASIDDPVASQPVAYQVTVGPSIPTQGTPTGTVQFFVDGAPLGGPVTLDQNGQADSPLTIALPAGPHAVTIGYSGDDYFLTIPTSPAFPQVVEKAAAEARILSANPAAAVVGQPVTVTVQVDPVAPANDTPDGQVTVSNGTDTCLAVLDAAGSGTCQLTASAPGSPDLTADYSGSDNFNSDTSEPFAGLVVSKANSVVGITGFSPANPRTGQPVTIQFTAAPAAPGWAEPTGMVTITDRQGRSCTASIAAGQCEIAFDSAGPTGLTAAYEGNANLNPSQSVEVSGPVVEKASTTLVLVSSDPASVYGQPVSFTAQTSVEAPGAGTPTGLVQFVIDDLSYGSPVSLAAGSAVLPDVAGLPVAAHTIAAVYLGDADFSGASALVINQSVSKADTTLSLSSNLNPSPYGMSVLITAALAGSDPSQAIPTSGTVQFIVDGVIYGAPVALNENGQALKLLPYTALWVGQHNITAIYSGSAYFNGSDNLANALEQVVEKGDLLITLEPDLLNPAFGQPVGFYARVAGSGSNNPQPTGDVQFGVDGIDLGSPVTLDSAGEALSDLIADLAVGAHTLNLSYSGDDYYQPTTVSLPSGVIVGRADVVVTPGPYTPAAAVVGQPVTFTFEITAAAPGAGVPTGLVTVNYAGGSCTASAAEGSCELIPTGLTQEGAALSIAYSGDENFRPGANDLQEGPAIGPASVTVTISGASPSPVVVGQPYTVNVQVVPAAPATFIPAGQTVTVSNGVTSCTATVQADGSASCDIVSTSAGQQNLIAAFEGGDKYNDATSSVYEGFSVSPADTAVTLVSSLNPVVEGAPVHFTASVQTIFPGSGTATGQVQFVVDGENAGSPVDMLDGTAVSPEISDLAQGSHAVSAVYLGSADYNTSTSAALSQKSVEGDLSDEITPGSGEDLVFESEQNGITVTTRVVIPVGAVSENVTLVFHQFYDSMLTPPAGQGFVASFTVDAFIDGALQPSLTFNEPVTFTMSYNPKNWDETSLTVVGWDGSQWTANGISILEQDQEANTITFTLDGTGMSEFALSGTPEYLIWIPVMAVNRP